MMAVALKDDIPRPEPLHERLAKVFGEELAEKITDVHMAWLEEWNPYRVCADCGERPFIFMLKDELWDQIGPRVSHEKDATRPTGFLCIFCCEKRLGRNLVISDFTTAGVNEQIFWALAGLRLVPVKRDT
jgi:hypothetical protein